MIIRVKTAVCGLLTVLLLLALSGFALAGGPCGHDMPGPNPAETERQIGEKLAKLVEDGTISKDQSERIQQHWREKDKERQADFAAMKEMSPEERKAYMEGKKKDRPDMEADLMKAAGLSREKAKVVADALRPSAPPPKKPLDN